MTGILGTSEHTALVQDGPMQGDGVRTCCSNFLTSAWSHLPSLQACILFFCFIVCPCLLDPPPHPISPSAVWVLRMLCTHSPYAFHLVLPTFIQHMGTVLDTADEAVGKYGHMWNSHL